MKTSKFLLLILAATLTLVACGGGEDEPEPTPVNPPTPQEEPGKYLTQICTMPADASETIVTLNGLTTAISRTSGSASWLNITKQTYTNGAPAVKVECAQNLDVDPREQAVMFIATKDTLVLTVHQESYSGGGTDVNNPYDTPTDQPAYVKRK